MSSYNLSSIDYDDKGLATPWPVQCKRVQCQPNPVPRLDHRPEPTVVVHFTLGLRVSNI